MDKSKRISKITKNTDSVTAYIKLQKAIDHILLNIKLLFKVYAQNRISYTLFMNKSTDPGPSVSSAASPISSANFKNKSVALSLSSGSSG